MLWIAFILLSSVIFAILLIGTRRSSAESSLDRRIELMLASKVEREAANTSLVLQQSKLKTQQEKALEDHLSSLWFGARVRSLITHAHSTTSVTAVLGTMFVIVVLVFAGVDYFLSSPAVAAIVACIAGAVPYAVLAVKRQKRLNAFNAALPDCIDLCARSLRVGHSIVAALGILAEESVEPARTEFVEVFNKQNYGLPLRDALLQMLDRVPSMDLQVFVTGILVQKDTGGNLAEILDRIVQVIRERIRIKRDIRVHTAQGRLTGWILCLLPPIMLLLINVMNPGYSDVLFNTPVGRKMLYAGGGLLLFGGFLIRRIVNGIEV